MKNCPKCGELLGDTVNTCFKCRYDFNLRRVITSEELSGQRNKRIEEQQKEIEEARQRQEQIAVQLSKNPLFEYQVVSIEDLSTGQSDNEKIQKVLNLRSQEGWRLHSIYTNEIGKSSMSVTIAGFGSVVNATIDQTILIFERCIKS